MATDPMINPVVKRRKKVLCILAERVGFEPTVTCATKVFKTFALDRYATPPMEVYCTIIGR